VQCSRVICCRQLFVISANDKLSCSDILRMPQTSPAVALVGEI
jgi:hypothetical protein